MEGRYALTDVLHELIAQETASLREIPMFNSDGRKAVKRKADLVRMRKLSKRDAYYRIVHILRGYDTEFPLDKIGGFDETN